MSFGGPPPGYVGGGPPPAGFFVGGAMGGPPPGYVAGQHAAAMAGPSYQMQNPRQLSEKELDDKCNVLSCFYTFYSIFFTAI